MTKFKAVIHVEVVYDVDLSIYGTDNLQEALKIDQANIDDDPFMFLGSDTSNWQTTVEIVKE